MPNWWLDDPCARLLVERRAGPAFGAHAKALEAAGERIATELPALSAAADRHRPTLHRFDAFGSRADRVEYHPSYEGIRKLARDVGIVHSAHGPKPAPRVVTMGLGYLFGESEAGYYCPVCLTDGTAEVLRRHGTRELVDRFLPRLASPDVSTAMEGAMFLTEKDGGSDVGGGTRTVAEPTADGRWTLTGDKWFCSNVDADLAFTLARPKGAPAGTKGLGLFLLPRRRDDGTPNAIRIERLKDKLGVTSMATGEIVLDGAVAWLVKPPPDGFRAMADMLNVSRIYNAVASIGVARQSVRLHAAEGRRRIAFGKPLCEHPLWRRRTIDLAVETEAASGLVFEACAMMDRPQDAKALRALTPVVKAATAKLAVRAASEACEALGGNGYVEDFPTPRLLRDAQVLPIWEGTTNVLALDLLRSLDEGALPELLDAGDAAIPTGEGWQPARDRMATARRLVEDVAVAPREAREADAWDLLQVVNDALALAVLAGDAAWAGAREGGRKRLAFERLVARPAVDDLASYRTLVEGAS